jgi:hypothetical protein
MTETGEERLGFGDRILVHTSKKKIEKFIIYENRLSG